MHVKTENAAVATGIGGLDNILGGGFVKPVDPSMLERLLAAPAREKKRGPPVGGRTDPGEESINAIDRLS